MESPGLRALAGSERGLRGALAPPRGERRGCTQGRGSGPTEFPRLGRPLYASVCHCVEVGGLRGGEACRLLDKLREWEEVALERKIPVLLSIPDLIP